MAEAAGPPQDGLADLLSVGYEEDIDALLETWRQIPGALAPDERSIVRIRELCLGAVRDNGMDSGTALKLLNHAFGGVGVWHERRVGEGVVMLGAQQGVKCGECGEVLAGNDLPLISCVEIQIHHAVSSCPRIPTSEAARNRRSENGGSESVRPGNLPIAPGYKLTASGMGMDAKHGKCDRKLFVAAELAGRNSPDCRAWMASHWEFSFLRGQETEMSKARKDKGFLHERNLESNLMAGDKVLNMRGMAWKKLRKEFLGSHPQGCTCEDSEPIPEECMEDHAITMSHRTGCAFLRLVRTKLAEYTREATEEVLRDLKGGGENHEELRDWEGRVVLVQASFMPTPGFYPKLSRERLQGLGHTGKFPFYPQQGSNGETFNRITHVSFGEMKVDYIYVERPGGPRPRGPVTLK